MLTKQSFLDRKPSVKKVEIPEWNDSVYIKKLSGKDRAGLLSASVKVEGKDVTLDQDNFMNTIVRTVQMALCDENGVRLFTDSIEDFEALNGQDGDILDRLFQEVTTYNSIGASEEKEAIKN